jgi:hypothetical protein
MINLTIDSVLQAYQKYNYKLFTDGEYNLNIFGVRLNDNLDQFTDIRGVLYKIHDNWILWQTPCTTKAGLFALKHPENPMGCATLKEGQYCGNWTIGYHKGIVEPSHRALIQKADGYKLPVYRDFEKDGIIRFIPNHLQDNGLGINLHGTYNYNGATPPSVYNWSEGCQVIGSETDQMTFMNLCDKAAPIHGNSFSYTLFNINDFVHPLHI